MTLLLIALGVGVNETHDVIEQLPHDLRDRFTEMRELDLKVQNTIDLLDTRVRRFFSDARKNKSDIVEEEYKNIHSSYKAALDDADEKVSMASQIYDLVDRHLRKLDQELGRFKIELEADCSGITETLEKNVDKTSAFSDDITFEQISSYNAPNSYDDRKRTSSFEHLSSYKNGNIDKPLSYPGLYSSPLGTSYPLAKSPKMQRKSTLSLNNTRKHDTSGPFQSVNGALTSNKSLLQDSKEEGRGAQASLKAMTAAQKKAEQLGNSLSMSGLLATSSSKQSSTSSSPMVDVTSHSNMFGGTPSNTLLKQNPLHTARSQKTNNRRNQKSIASSRPGGDKSFSETSLDWVPDPNEPTYCLCNQVSYGEMVGCDNASCPIEWFHYGCVGLTDAPKGKWYCPDCAAQIKRKRVR